MTARHAPDRVTRGPGIVASPSRGGGEITRSDEGSPASNREQQKDRSPRGAAIIRTGGGPLIRTPHLQFTTKAASLLLARGAAFLLSAGGHEAARRWGHKYRYGPPITDHRAPG